MKDTNPAVVSVIIPVYNREKTVKNAIESVLNQTISVLELIVVDDASTDNSLRIIQSIKDSRVKCISLLENVGAPAARNIGIKAARGEWIAFHDSDDVWHREKIEKQMNAIPTNPDILPIIYTSFIRYQNGKQELIPNDSSGNYDGDIHSQLLLGNFITTQTLLVPKQYFVNGEYFNEDIPRFQDWELCLRLSQHYPFIWIREPLVDVFYTVNSISADQEKLIEAYEIIIKEHKDIFLKAGNYYVASLFFSYGHNLCLLGEMKKGRKALCQSFRYHMSSLKCILSLFCSIFGKRFYKKVYDVIIKRR